MQHGVPLTKISKIFAEAV